VLLELAPSEAAPSEAAPSETAPSEASPSEADPSEAAPSKAAPSLVAPSEMARSELAPSEWIPRILQTLLPLLHHIFSLVAVVASLLVYLGSTIHLIAQGHNLHHHSQI
jgi:hypothetical protein